MAEQERRLQGERIALAARSYPVWLREARCTRCHGAEHYTNQRYGWLGWTLVTMRMKYLNGAADVTVAERAVFTDKLTTRLPAPLANAVFEYLAAGAMVFAPIAASDVALRRRRKSLTEPQTIVEGNDAHR